MLLKNLSDLILDTPDAPTVLGNFIARAIADDCLPPKFVQSYKDKVECDHARQALLRADTLLSMKHGLVRLDNVWGVGGGLRPVKYLVRQMNLLLQEYLSSGDLHEAQRCLMDLEVPHFHHELVYEAVVMVIEAISGQVEEAMCRLLKILSSAIIITPDLMERGFLRVYEDMPDICLDVPLAYTVLERFVERCHKAGFLTDPVIKKMPSSLPDRDANLDLPVIGSQAQHETSALANYATEAGSTRLGYPMSCYKYRVCNQGAVHKTT
nr:unnamed protein product [Timema cristinae]